MNYVVFDLDGTLALIDHRRHLVTGKRTDWELFAEMCIDDRPNEPVIEVLRGLHAGKFFVEIWSARSAIVRASTINWLVAHHVPFHELRMRPIEEPDVPDDVLKKSWLTQKRSTYRNDPFIVFDDRDKVVNMWRSEGITCCQVAPGDF